MTTKKENPMCPRLTAEQKLELRSLQLADANLANTINQATQQRAKIQAEFNQKAMQFANELNVDVEKVQLTMDELKFELRPGVKGRR